MNPTVAVDIVDRDRTGPGRKAAEKGFAGFAKRTQEQADKSGFARLGKHIDAVKGASKMTLAFDGMGRSLGDIATLSGKINAALAIGTQRAINFGREGEGALEGVVSTGAKAVGMLGGLAAGIVAAVAASAALGGKWAEIGAKVQRTAQDIGIGVEDLQAAEAVGERFGVDKGSTDSGLGALSGNLVGARYGTRNDILAADSQLGLQTKFDQGGNPDTKAFLYDLSDAIARQTNRQKQKEIADLYGVGAMLPLLRQGSAAIKAQEQDYRSTGAALSAEDAAKATSVNRKGIAVRQRAGAIEKTAGVASLSVTDTAFNVADAALRGAKSVTNHPDKAAGAVVDAAKSAGSIILDSGKGFAGLVVAGGAKVVDAFEAFARRIEHQESGGRQFDRHGAPLRSTAGAIGAMQMLLPTAKETAARHGIGWDPDRFAHDKTYNEHLGQLHLGDLMGRFGGDQVLASAAYNAGEGRVDKWIKSFGDPRRGEISDADFAARIPGAYVDTAGRRHERFQETRDYVHNTAHVEITLKGAPAGTTAKVTAAPGMSVGTNIVRPMGDAG